MRVVKTAVLLGLVLLLPGCGGLYSAPLPGGADLGSHPYNVTVRFPDVLELVPQASVKVNDVDVGKVEEIELAPDNRSAIVHVAVNGDVRLPGNAQAKLRQSSLLGDKFVELAEPVREQPVGQLREGMEIPLEKTNRNPEIEEVLGALSMLLNGGNVSQLQTIVHELNTAMSGNEAQMRSMLSRVDQLTTELDGQRGEIVRAIDSLNRMSSTFVQQQDHLRNALDNLGPGLEVVNEQRDQLVTMLSEVDRLSGVATDTVQRSRKDMVADLRALEPTLRNLAKTGEDLPKALDYLQTYPFPPRAVEGMKGDFGNADIFLDLDLSNVVENLVKAQPSGPSIPDSPIPLPLPPKPDLPAREPKPPEPPKLPLPKPPPPPSDSGRGLFDSLFGGS